MTMFSYMKLSPSTICLCTINCQIQITYHTYTNHDLNFFLIHSIHSINSPTLLSNANVVFISSRVFIYFIYVLQVSL